MRRRVTAYRFAVPFGVSGLAQCWLVAHAAGVAPACPVNVVHITAGALWLTVTAGCRPLLALRWRLSQAGARGFNNGTG